MNKKEHINYWLETAEIDFKAMNSLFESKDYVWSLFLGHPVIEKIMKALLVRSNIDPIPKIHDLNKLAELTSAVLNDDRKNLLDIITSFNIEARYPDYKKEFYKKCDYEFTNK